MSHCDAGDLVRGACRCDACYCLLTFYSPAFWHSVKRKVTSG
jgi:hypothetical protein